MMESRTPKMTARDVGIFYRKERQGPRRRKNGRDKIENESNEKQAVIDVSADIFSGEILACMGPSGCGKSSFLKSLNRIIVHTKEARVTGEVRLDGVDTTEFDVSEVCRRVGMVFQKANPFPKSIFDNVAYGPNIHGLAKDHTDLEEIVERSLTRAGLWDEVKDDLDEPGTQLSGGQQQRLCIARAIATDPEVLLLDEPTSALDPIAAGVVEELMERLRKEGMAIVLVSHMPQQVAHVAQRVMMFHGGRVVEAGPTADVFINPRHDITQRFLRVLINGASGDKK